MVNSPARFCAGLFCAIVFNYYFHDSLKICNWLVLATIYARNGLSPMQTFWDERYSIRDYVYGIHPNDYFREKLDTILPGKLLLPGEGEGRNAVYAASAGWEVTAFDTSEEGQKKAYRLAAERSVHIDYRVDSYDTFLPDESGYDAVGLFFTHTPPAIRQKFHRKLASSLRPNGVIILEAFEKEQINRDTGGPGNIQLLYDTETLKRDFTGVNIIHIEKVSRKLNEGLFHQGEAWVVRMFATRTDN